ncbi:hypothetical protein PFISCL1PPCAC_27099, partial [Pristionchus fissidentatus]
LSTFISIATADCGEGNVCIENRTVAVPHGWSNGRIWARTGCDAHFNCETGFCGNKLQCESREGESPVTVAEFTLDTNGLDHYDVSLINGFNVPVFIDVEEGTHQVDGGLHF